jgi:hypothetical protein
MELFSTYTWGKKFHARLAVFSFPLQSGRILRLKTEAFVPNGDRLADGQFIGKHFTHPPAVKETARSGQQADADTRHSSGQGAASVFAQVWMLLGQSLMPSTGQGPQPIETT